MATAASRLTTLVAHSPPGLATPRRLYVPGRRLGPESPVQSGCQFSVGLAFVGVVCFQCACLGGPVSLSPLQVLARLEADVRSGGPRSRGGSGSSSSSTCVLVGHRGCRPGGSNASRQGGHGTRVPWGVYCGRVTVFSFAFLRLVLCSGFLFPLWSGHTRVSVY